MTIIEAFQKAENGALITNGFMKAVGRFLKYIGNGVFFEYEVINGKSNYKYEVRTFSVAEVITIDWEVVENKYFDK